MPATFGRTGQGLAVANVEPDEFLTFVRGGLRTQFIGMAAGLEERVRSLGERPDPHAMLRVDEFTHRTGGDLSWISGPMPQLIPLRCLIGRDLWFSALTDASISPSTAPSYSLNR